jgi:tetratricopeptide (TPR) repeat protein
MRHEILVLLFLAASALAGQTGKATAGQTVKSTVKNYEGTITIPTYEHSGRELEPPLFASSTAAGMYPFTTYLMPFKAGGPKPKTYATVVVENEYLKLTYIPDFGGHIFSLYDKIRQREVFYRNDVIKPAPYNPRNSWPQSGLELTGPHDLHTLTLNGEPFWANRIVHNEDGSVSLVLGETDPVYGMEVNLIATLHPGVAALEIGVRCYNPRAAQMPQMMWINTAINATPKTRFIYPMTRTVGHTTADIADWPLYNGLDYSWDRNNTHMLGVFGIDSYDNFQGAYQFDRDYGIFRYGDRRVVQGMKLWTFGYGESAKEYEQGYTDNAGPYVELQSGRYVWDGHYEWVAPHKTESWNEWWVPVAGTGGLTTLTRDVALNLEIPQSKDGTGSLVLAATRPLAGAVIHVTARSGELLRTKTDLSPAQPYKAAFTLRGDSSGIVVTVTAGDGATLLEYHRPETDPGRKQYTPFTKPLERPRKPVEEMSAEELAIAAEYRMKELDGAGATRLLEKALAHDAGYSRAHLMLGIQDFKQAHFDKAVAQLEKSLERDPYSYASYYYLAMSQLALGENAKAERNLFFLVPESGFFGEREYNLGRLALLRKDLDGAVSHLERALSANSTDLIARLTLALAYRERGEEARALRELAEAERVQPASRLVQAERFFLDSDGLATNPAAKPELLRLLGRQSQEALSTSLFYRDLGRWGDAVRLLRLVEDNNGDPFGTPAEFYYSLAYCQRRAGDAGAAGSSLKKARAAAGKIDRFPFRPESEAPLAEAVKLAPNDGVAHNSLACLLYFLGRPEEAIEHWKAALAANPSDFSSHRALGLAYAEQGTGVDAAAVELRRAVELNPAHVRTLNDLSNLYARAGRFDEQLSLLSAALARSPKDDDLAEGVLAANLMMGRYAEAEHLIQTHPFSPRHRSYGLRDKYRMLRYAKGATAFNRGDYTEALRQFESSMTPPVSLGVDDFQAQTSPRQQYYLGRTYEALGKTSAARAAFEKAIAGVEQLSGDRDSWSSENYFMVLSLERLGRGGEAAQLHKHFADFAHGEADDRQAQRRAEARYLLGLVNKHDGHADEALKSMRGALDARPDLLPARLELRGQALDSLMPKAAN